MCALRPLRRSHMASTFTHRKWAFIKKSTFCYIHNNLCGAKFEFDVFMFACCSYTQLAVYNWWPHIGCPLQSSESCGLILSRPFYFYVLSIYRSTVYQIENSYGSLQAVLFAEYTYRSKTDGTEIIHNYQIKVLAKSHVHLRLLNQNFIKNKKHSGLRHGIVNRQNN